MSDLIQGTIKSIKEQSGQNAKGAWKRWEYEMTDGKHYATFDADIGKKFKVGDFVEMQGYKKGKYWTMSTMDYASEENRSSKPSPTHSSQSSSDDILRQVLAELRAIRECLQNDEN